MKKHTYTLLAAATFAAAGSANAAILLGQSIGLDFGDVAATNNFNSIAATGTSGDLFILTDGTTTTGVTVTVSDDGSNNFFNDDSGDSLTGLSSDYNISNVTDWYGAGGSGTQTLTFVFSGLDSNLTYNIQGVIGGFTGNGVTDGTSMTIDGSTQDFSPDTMSSDPRIVNFSDISVDSGTGTTDGSLTITVQNGGIPVISALTISTVPEPSSTALLGLGGLALILRRRK
jgi:hypothetical protein